MDKEWLEDFEDETFLIVYDVLIDVRQAAQLRPEAPLIPLWQSLIKFPQLYPGDSVGMRDRYCEQRWNAVNLLEKLGAIDAVKAIEEGGSHRWDTQVEFVVQDRLKLREAKAAMDSEYACRFGNDARNSKAAGRRIFIWRGLAQLQTNLRGAPNAVDRDKGERKPV